MRNNGLIFLGFLIVCLVNLSGARSHHSAAPPPKEETAKRTDSTDLKMATEIPPVKASSQEQK